MALLWIEGFEWMGAADNATEAPAGVVQRKYPDAYWQFFEFKLQAGRTGGHALEMCNWNDWIDTPLLTTNATLVAGFAYQCAGDFLTNGKILAFNDDDTVGVNVMHAASGELKLNLNGSSVNTTGLGLVRDTWYYLELKVVCATTGSYVLRVNGLTVLSGSGNTKFGTHAYHNWVTIGGSSGTNSGTSRRFDDLYLLDGSGTVNNDLLGERKVVAIRPNGDVAGSVNWTPSAAVDHYTAVDENPVNDETDYVESSTTDQLDLYEYASATGIGSIDGIQINTMARLSDAKDLSLKTVINSGGTQDDGTAVPIRSANYRVIRRISETDPHTAAPWSLASLNAAQFGVKIG
jgi:hypothetical protein